MNKKDLLKNDYYRQYGELFEKAQTVGMYKIFLLDVAGSKEISHRLREKFYLDMDNFVNDVMGELLKLEEERNIKILHRHYEAEELINNNLQGSIPDKVILIKNQNNTSLLSSVFQRIDQINPLHWMGDLMHFIINKESITDNEFEAIATESRNKYIPYANFHYASGCYETDVWADSGSEMSRIYCLPILEHIAKINNNKTFVFESDLDKTEAKNKDKGKEL